MVYFRSALALIPVPPFPPRSQLHFLRLQHNTIQQNGHLYISHADAQRGYTAVNGLPVLFVPVIAFMSLNKSHGKGLLMEDICVFRGGVFFFPRRAALCCAVRRSR